MNRDPKVIGRARVYAETMAEVVNGFVDPISWKTLVRKPLTSGDQRLMTILFLVLHFDHYRLWSGFT